MARRADDLGATIVVVNPDEDCSAAAGRRVIDDVLASPDEPAPESLHAAEIHRWFLNPEPQRPRSSSRSDSKYGSAI